MTFHTPEDVRIYLALRFQAGDVPRPEWTADLAMAIVRPVLEERDREITRLRGLLAEYVVTGKDSSEEGERP